MITTASINSRKSIQNRDTTGKISRFAPFWMLLVRPAIALLAQGLTVFLFMQLSVQSPALAVRNWWTVYSTLVDFVCLGLLIWLTGREGIRLLDLVSFDRSKLKTDILIGLGILFIVFPVTIIGGGRLAMLLAYGSLDPELPYGALFRVLPLIAVIYSRMLWWILWSFTEELTFQGYCLPRLQVLTKKTWLSVMLVSMGWSVQHSFLPWINLQHAAYLFIAFVPLTIVLQLIYLRVRRLPGLILGHWLMDLASVLLLLQIG